MAWIDLYDGRSSLGRYDLPEHLQTKDGIYRIDYGIRQGGNGVVFGISRMEGFQQFTQPFALKVQKRLDSTRVDRFDNEVRVLQECDHPQIAAYRDHGDLNLGGNLVPWVVMSLGEENLRRFIDSQGPLDKARVKSVGVEACDAIAHLHNLGFIHRDIKPENFVWCDKDFASILMIDFGIAKRLNEDVSGRPMDNFTQRDEFVGPVFFSSPELIAYASDKSHTVDFRSDYFQLGKLLWFFGTGRISAGVPSARLCPFQGKLHELVLDLIQDDPADRLQDMTSIRERLIALS